jgi:hypothetical protein
MTLTSPGIFLAAALALWVLAAPRAEAACSDKKIVAMANDGRTVNAIAKACSMPTAKVRGLASCDCQGMVPYGERAPDLRCQSGMSMATPCAGYCSPHGVAPWRRICS